MRRWPALSVVSGAVALVLGHASVGHAQLDVAQRAFAEARFERALRAVDRALDDARSGVAHAEALELRLRIAFAMNERGPAYIRDLDRLVAIDRSHEFAPETPPEIREAFSARRSLSPVNARAAALIREPRFIAALVPDTTHDDRPLVTGILVGAAAVTIVAIIVAVAVATASPSTELRSSVLAPTLAGFP